MTPELASEVIARAAALAGDAVTVEFSFDKALAPSDADRRELSAVFSSAGLEAK